MNTRQLAKSHRTPPIITAVARHGINILPTPEMLNLSDPEHRMKAEEWAAHELEVAQSTYADGYVDLRGQVDSFVAGLREQNATLYDDEGQGVEQPYWCNRAPLLNGEVGPPSVTYDLREVPFVGEPRVSIPGWWVISDSLAVAVRIDDDVDDETVEQSVSFTTISLVPEGSPRIEMPEQYLERARRMGFQKSSPIVPGKPLIGADGNWLCFGGYSTQHGWKLLTQAEPDKVGLVGLEAPRQVSRAVVILLASSIINADREVITVEEQNPLRIRAERRKGRILPASATHINLTELRYQKASRKWVAKGPTGAPWSRVRGHVRKSPEGRAFKGGKNPGKTWTWVAPYFKGSKDNGTRSHIYNMGDSE